MVKHIILWTLKDEYTEAQKKEIRAVRGRRLATASYSINKI